MNVRLIREPLIMSRRILSPELPGVTSVTSDPSSAGEGQSSGPVRYVDVEQQLGYSFADATLLERALTHRSAQASQANGNYERLEYIGDAVFDLAVAHLLSIKHEHASEGELSKMRAALVNATSLAGIARRISLGKFVKLSRSEMANGASDRSSILADVLEAIVGAIYLEAGFEVARECISRLLGDDILTVTPRDPKTELQELLHASGGGPPVYRIECTEGPEHSPVFVSTVEVNGRIVGRGRGSTKKASQQIAAEEALLKMALNRDSVAEAPQPRIPATVELTERLVEVEAHDHDNT